MARGVRPLRLREHRYPGRGLRLRHQERRRPREGARAADRKRERIYAEVRTPSGGAHYYIQGHPDLPTVHSKKDDPKLPDFPGLDIQSHGANVFAPLTMRPKYGGGGYTVVRNELNQIPGDRRRRADPAHRVGGRAVGVQR